MEVNRSSWRLMEAHGGSWKLMEAHGSSWKLMVRNCVVHRSGCSLLAGCEAEMVLLVDAMVQKGVCRGMAAVAKALTAEGMAQAG